MNKADDRRLLEDLYYAAIEAVNPAILVERHMEMVRRTFSDGHFKKLIMVALGKAACSMAAAAEDGLSGMITDAAAITKYGHCSKRSCLKKTRVFEGGHPEPDEAGHKATSEVLGLLDGADESTMILFLISGGGSSLFVAPWEGVTLSEKRAVTSMLLRAGAKIDELNAVRKHLSVVKGGRVLEKTHHAGVLALVLSDVIGDDLGVIASGPVYPDETSYADAIRILDKYGLSDDTPGAVMKVLKDGAKGLLPETPKQGHSLFDRVKNIIVGSNHDALTAIRDKAAASGLSAEIIAEGLTGEARDVGVKLAREAAEAGRLSPHRKRGVPLGLISGGETTVTVKGSGEGGRNMELALSYAGEIRGTEGISFLSAGTDGNDGPTDAAGAFVDTGTFRRAVEMGLDPVVFLEKNDSYSFFKKTGGLFITGPTGTNVMDVQIAIVR